jgi:peroxiredoxin family protein
MMADKKVASVEELRQTAIDLDVRLLACKMSMDVLEVTRDELIPEVDSIAGVATFVKDAAGSKIQLFI